jgi:hypothetical protein
MQQEIPVDTDSLPIHAKPQALLYLVKLIDSE